MNRFSATMIELINVLAEMTIIFIYFNKVFRRKYDENAIYITAYMLSSGILFLMVLFYSEAFALFLITVAILLALSFAIYSEKTVLKLFYVFIYLLIILVADPVLMGIMYILKLGSPDDLLESNLERIIGMVGTKILYIWMVLVISRVLMKKVRELPLKYWTVIILMPIMSIVILYSIFISVAVAENRYNMFIYIVSITGIVYMNIVMFNFFESYSTQIKLAFMESVAEREAENYRSFKIAYQEMKKLKHDFQNELAIINDLIENKKYDKAEAYISELLVFIEKSAAVCYTGNEAIDSLVNIKIKIAERYNIRFTVKIKLYSVLEVNSMEMCRIIGNALDNAIEACCNITNVERFIFLSFKEVDENVLLEISNSSEYTDTNDLTSSKSDKRLHGYGVQSICSSAERIGGTICFKYEDGVFTFKLLMRNN